MDDDTLLDFFCYDEALESRPFVSFLQHWKTVSTSIRQNSINVTRVTLSSTLQTTIKNHDTDVQAI